jgi:hypothetical protein
VESNVWLTTRERHLRCIRNGNLKVHRLAQYHLNQFDYPPTPYQYLLRPHDKRFRLQSSGRLHMALHRDRLWLKSGRSHPSCEVTDE